VGTFSAVRANLTEAADRALAAALANQAWMKATSPLSTPGEDSPVVEGNSLLKLRTAIDRVKQLRPTIEPILRGEGVPVELSAVVLVESGGLTTALSPKGARGVWQFMPDTARRYGLVVDGARDDRTDVIKSTHAAARYLRDLRARFGDWSLALAAYNAGELAVTNAMSRAPSRDFRSLSDTVRLPVETRRYVPAVGVAMNRLYSQSSSIRMREINGKQIVYATSGSGE
jgi:membrane-bound lytic murein transglycosylase MltF